MAASLNIETDGVRDAATAAAAAAGTAPTPAVTVTPCAADAVSVQMATRLCGAASALNAGTIGVHSRTAAAGAHLASTAQTYDEQDLAASRVLARGGGAGAGVVPVASMAIPALPPVVAPPGLPAGAEPVTGLQASALIHDGPGADGFDTAATILDNHAADLDRSAAQVRSARATSETSWASQAGENAHDHLHRLEADYTSQAEAARLLSQHFRTHAEDYRRTKSAIPAPQVFDTLTQRLKMAVAANSTPPTVGLYGPAITALQGQLAEANHTAMTAYQQYRAAALTPSITNPPGGGQGGGGAGTAPGGDAGAEHDPAGTTDGLDAASGGEDTALGLPGLETLAAGSDPAAAALGGEPGSELLGTVVPALLGGVTGLVGGLVGGLAAAGQGVQQAGTQLVGGLTQAATSAANAAAAKASVPDLSAELGTGDFGGGAGDFGGGDFGGGDFGGGGGDFGDVGDFGGGNYGDTSPAATAGGAPGTFPAAAPVTAAPATFSPGGVTAPATAPGMAGPGMMPPMMPMGMAGAAAGADADRRLYPERRLRVESPANAEPVKGRREARKTRTKSGKDTGEGSQ